MKKLFFFLLLAAGILNSQTNLGINYNNGDPSNSTPLESVRKITFSNTDVEFVLTNNTSISKPLTQVRNIFFSGSGGENPLPVELVSFSANIRGNAVILPKF